MNERYFQSLSFFDLFDLFFVLYINNSKCIFIEKCICRCINKALKMTYSPLINDNVV